MSTIEIIVITLIGAMLAGVYWRRTSLADNAPNKSNPDQALSEAEILLAYGRKSEAIQILREASKTYPGNLKIQGKLEELKRES